MLTVATSSTSETWQNRFVAAPYDSNPQTRVWGLIGERGGLVTNCPEGVNYEHLAILWAALAASGRIHETRKQTGSGYTATTNERI